MLAFLQWLSNLEIILMFLDPYNDEHGPYVLIKNLHPAIPQIEVKAVTMPADSSDNPLRMLRLEFRSKPLYLTLDIGPEAISLNCR